MLAKEKVEELMKKNEKLSIQSYDQIPSLNPQSKSIISRQATINIGDLINKNDSLNKIRNNWACCSW